MNKLILKSLVDEYKDVFSGVTERSGFEYRKYHGLRVMSYCAQWIEQPFLKNEKINKDALLVAALFHDIGKSRRVNADKFMVKNEDNNDRHELVGAKIIGDYIGKYFDNKDFIEKVASIIKEHCGDEVLEFESHILRDADLFDNYGSVHITRMVAYGEHNGRNVEGMLERWWIVERGDFEKKLSHFHFDEVRKMAKDRLEKLDIFFDDLNKENKGYLGLIS